MNAPPINGFAAQLLERGASGYAGYAAAALIEREPRLRELFAPDALGSWRHNLTQRVLELAAALSAAEPRLFVSRAVWTGKAFRARHQDETLVRGSLNALREVLAERLPEPARGAPLDYLDQALAALDEPAAADGPELDPDRPADRLALRYLQKVLEGDVAAAVQEVTGAVRDGFDRRAAYLEVLLPAQREVGRLWHLGEVNVAEEHLVTSATQRCMAVLASGAPATTPNGKTAIVAAVASNAHDVGLRAVADLYQMSGWRTIFLGADVPMEDLPAMLNYFQADLLLLGATLATQVPRVQQAIAGVRANAERPVKVIVGGAAFDEADTVWKAVGADGYAGRVDEAVTLGGRLVGA
jgi:methanogenic corrinoid protein MtbC1